MVQFRQADGTLTTGVQLYGASQYSTGTVFLPGEAKAPTTATVNAMVVYDTFDGTNHVLKDVGGATLGSDGALSAAVTFNQILDLSTKTVTQVVDVQAGTTTVTIDLALGQHIELAHDENVTITFTNVPVGKVTPVLITRIKGNNTTPKTIAFTHTLKTEGCQKLVFSNVASSISTLFLYINGTGEVYARLPVNNIAAISGTISQYQSSNLISPQAANRNVTANTIVTFTSNGSFLSTDVVWDGSTFSSPVYSVKNTIKLMYYTVEAKTASTGATDITFNCNNAVFGTLLMNDNVTSLALSNIPSGAGLTHTVFVKHANDAVSRDITWGADYKYDTKPALTQKANAEDILVITTLDGASKLVQCYQNFGTPV
jgi:hypothetical protein